MNQNQIYQNIRELRIFTRLSQKQIARKLNIVPSGYGKIERGDTQLTIERLVEISNIFKVTPEYILNYHLRKKSGNMALRNRFVNKGIGEHHEKDILLGKYEFVILLYKYQVESYILSIHEKCCNNYPELAQSFNQYMEKEDYKWAFDMIKSDIEDYNNDSTFEPPYSLTLFNRLKVYSDEQLMEYLTSENNYDLEIFEILYCPHYRSEESTYNAFIDMLENPNVLGLFEYGLATGIFEDFWKKYKKENVSRKYTFAEPILPVNEIESLISNINSRPVVNSLDEYGCVMRLSDFNLFENEDTILACKK